MKVPVIIASSIICLCAGLGIGVLGTTYYGPIDLPPWLGGPPEIDPELRKAPIGEPIGMAAKGKGGAKGGAKGGPGMGGGPKEPSPKAQLNALVAKLDVLTEKPITVTLNADAKKQIRQHLEGLDALDDLKEEDAKQRLEGLLAALESQKESLEAAGYRWPGSGGVMPLNNPNPFKMGDNLKHLKSLQERLGS
jgi:hypothetical protein